MTAVLGAEHNSFTGLVALVAYVSIYVVIMTGVVHSIFTLVNWLPSNALRMIGGAMGVHGIADNEEKEGQSRFNTVAASSRNAAFTNPGKADRPAPASQMSKADRDSLNSQLMPGEVRAGLD
jgi:hypothetical protein